MLRLFEKFKNFKIDEVIEVEMSDFQYISLKNMFEKINDKNIYLPLILANSIICYQLSSTWEKYWEEFSNKSIEYFSKENYKIDDIIIFFSDFLPSSKWNKRFIETKLKRLEKLKPFLEIFNKNTKFYYENMSLLNIELAKVMNQKTDDKTIVFAVKMFSYWARNIFNKLIYFPFEIFIPIDSRLTNIYELYKDDFDWNIKEFYLELSKKLNIPPLHLDWLIWVNYNNLI